jgi:hypothetical protein
LRQLIKRACAPGRWLRREFDLDQDERLQ